jgi:CDP-paratose 2-epimerase
MKILITGAAGFVGSTFIKLFNELDPKIELVGIDNLVRKGSEFNVPVIESLNCKFLKGDIRNQSDIDKLPKVDCIIDCAANPSVLAGLSNDSLDLIHNNLTSTFYLLEKCKKDNAGFIMLSTSRVYSIDQLNKIPLKTVFNKLEIDQTRISEFPIGFSEKGVSENFSNSAPISLYGATKLSSEIMALEYHHSFGFPVWINRVGVIAGPGQFGKIDQGIFSYWIYQYLLDKPLSFIGFGGNGYQVRDVVHPKDIFCLIIKQIFNPIANAPKIVNIGGGSINSYSLAQLNEYCNNSFKINKHIHKDPNNRPYDIPLFITDYSLAENIWDWKPTFNIEQILENIVDYANNNIDLIKKIN